MTGTRRDATRRAAPRDAVRCSAGCVGDVLRPATIFGRGGSVLRCVATVGSFSAGTKSAGVSRRPSGVNVPPMLPRNARATGAVYATATATSQMLDSTSEYRRDRNAARLSRPLGATPATAQSDVGLPFSP